MHLPLPFYHSIKIAQENSSSVHKDTGRVCYTFIKSFRLKGACSLYEPTRLCRTFPQKDSDLAAGARRTAARELAQRMLDHGRKRIVYIGGTERDDATGVQRREGVQDALNAAGLNGEQMPRICCNAFTMEEGQRCMQELLVRCPDLDGVVCVTDTVAFGAMRALREAGRHVGQDVGLAGVGDSWAGSMMEPGLATVRFYQKQVGQEAARILLQMLEENGSSGPVRQVTLGYQIVERGSL